MKTLNRDKIQRMFGQKAGGVGGSSVNTDGDGVSKLWVEQNYLSKEFFLRLFNIHGEDENDDPVDVQPNDLETTITDIEAMFGFWTEQYLSALGQNSEQGGGGITLNAALASINNAPLGNPTGTNTVLMFNGTTWVYASMGSTDMNTVWTALADGTDTHQINVSHLTTALGSYFTQGSGISITNTVGGTGKTISLAQIQDFTAGTYKSVTVDQYGRVTAGTNPTTLAGYGITDALASNTTFWGRTISAGAVKGGIDQASYIEFADIASGTTNGGYIDFHYGGNTTANSGDYTSRIIEDAFDATNSQGTLKINNILWAKLSTGVSIGTSTISSDYKLNVAGYTKTTRLYLADGVYLEYDSTNSGVHLVGAGFYSDSYVSALGVYSGGGGGGSDYIPLTGSDQIAGSLIPVTTNAYDLGDSTHTWRNIYGNGFKVTGKDDTYVLLAGGGTALLSTVTGNYVTLDTAQTITGLKTITSGLVVQGRIYNSGVDEGILIKPAQNGYAALILGINNNNKYFATYLHVNDSTFSPFFVLNDGATDYLINVPKKSGTMALLSDIPSIPDVSPYASSIIINNDAAVSATNHVITLSDIARRGQDNNLIGNNNEFNFIPQDYSYDYVYVNYRGFGGALSSTNGIVDYHLWNGKHSSGEYSYLNAKGYKINGGTSSQFLKADGSVDSSVYAKLWYTDELTFIPSGFTSTQLWINFRTFGTNATQLSAYNFMNGKQDATLSGYAYLIAYGYKTPNGTSSGFLKADGSIDTNPYITSSPTSIAVTTSLTVGGYNVYTTNDFSLKDASKDSNNNYIVGDLSWISGSVDSKKVVTSNALAYWNGKYDSGTGHSRLAYCNQGAFGDIITKNLSDNITFTGKIGIGSTNTNFDLYLDGKAQLSKGAKFYGICIECDKNGVLGGHSGEINDYDMPIYIQLASAYDIIACYGGGNVGIGTLSPSYKLDVKGTIGLSGTTKRIYFDSTHYVELDSSGYFHFSHGVYSDGFMSALGLNSGGGGAADYIPLSGSTSITGNLTPSNNNSVNLGSSSKLWAGVYCTNLRAYGASSIGGNLTMAGNITPTVNQQYGLGTSSLKFSSLHVLNSYTYGTLAVNNFTLFEDTYSPAQGVTYSQSHLKSTLNVMYLDCSSGIQSSNTITSRSDIRLKTIQRYIDYLSVDAVASAPIFDYTWNEKPNGNVFVGTSAQYWQQVLPNAVSPMFDRFLSLDYSATALVSVVTTARKVVDHEARIRLLEVEVENAARKVVDHEARIRLLEVENAALRNEINQLKKVA